MSVLRDRDDFSSESGNSRVDKSIADDSSAFAHLSSFRAPDAPRRPGRGSGDSAISFPSTPRSFTSPAPGGKRQSRQSFHGGRVVLPPAIPQQRDDLLLTNLKGLSTWAPVAYKATFEPGADGSPAALVLEDRRVLSDLSGHMLEQLNCMFAFMHQVVVRERARHASNVSMMMRKVDKDLKDTYDSVKEIFNSLTQQLAGLVKEVENSREQVKAIQEKYMAARHSAEAQAQYVLELESVLDGQCEGVSDTLRKLNEQSVGKSQALSKQTEAAKQKERKLKQENDRLKLELRKAQDMADQLLYGSLPPALPEMAASWTRRATSSSGHSEDGNFAMAGFCETVPEEGGGADIVGSVLAHCDASRAVPRAKPVRMPPRRPIPPQRRASDREVDELRKRAEQAEARCDRLQQLLGFSSTSLVLLREVVNQLRSSGYLVATESAGKLPPPEAGAAPAEVLTKVAQLFHEHAPKLKGLPEVLRALTHELAVGKGGGPASLHLAAGPPSSSNLGAELDGDAAAVQEAD